MILTKKRVDQIIADLNVVRSKYASMLEKREKYFNNLNDIVARIQAYNATDKKAVDDMKDKYCKTND